MYDDPLNNHMSFSYGQGRYRQRGKEFTGQIVLSGHKLYLKDDRGDITMSFIPLEKIYKIQCRWTQVKIFVRPSLFTKFVAVISGERRHIKELIKDLVDRRKFHKRKLGLEWVDADAAA